MTKPQAFVLALAISSLLATASPVSAQSDAKVGLAMGTPTAFSVIWHVDNRIALRPDIGFSHSTSENDVLGTEFSSTTVSPGISALFYVSSWDQVRAYVSPRYTWSHLSASNSSGSSQSSNAHAFAGSLGVQYTPHRRFGVYGEVGIGFSTVDAGDSSQTSTGVRHAIGAILYF